MSLYIIVIGPLYSSKQNEERLICLGEILPRKKIQKTKNKTKLMKLVASCTDN
jgi:hypothetical protein